MNFKDYVATIPHFPKEGIMFRDITPLVANGTAYKACIEAICDYARSVGANLVVGPEARGFIFGCPVACSLGVGFVPVRKPGKLPRETIETVYELEYGVNTLCLAKDDIKSGDKVVIVDDLLATGGTIKATTKLIEQLGGEVVGICCPIELPELNARKILEGYNVHTLMVYEGE